MAQFRQSYAAALLANKKLAEAEAEFRRCVDTYRKQTPGRRDLIANASSQLGECLFHRARFIEAEKMLLAAHENLLSTKNCYFSWAPASTRRIAQLYQAWNEAEPGKGYDVKFAEWNAKAGSAEPATQPDRPADAH